MSTSTRAEPKRALDPFIGSKLASRFRIERLIGRGGMGLVYLADDIVASQPVVVKLLAPHLLEDSLSVARFEQEGERLRQLVHPNIVQLVECGHDRAQGYIAMEYLDGEPLRRFLRRRGRLSLQEFTPIAAQTLAAVGYAHDRNLMLRDIKPANIMLCERDGKMNFVKLLDFGLAKLVDGDDEEATKSHVIGTAGYLAPEQIKGEPVDARVDVYALGVLFYLMLAGESPIQGENDGALLYNQVHGTPKSLAECLPAGHNVPERLIALVHQCLEKDPARRPADANEIAETLFECVAPRLFVLPLTNDESRAAMKAYREDRDREDGGPPSSEWTKPVVRSDAVVEPAEQLPLEPSASLSAAPLPRPHRPSGPDISGVQPRVQPTGAVPPVRVPTQPVTERRNSEPLAAANARPENDDDDGVVEVLESGIEELEPEIEPEVIADAGQGGVRELGAPVAIVDGGTGALRAESRPLPTALPVRRRYLVVVGICALLVGGMSAWILFAPPRTSPTTVAAAEAGLGAAEAARPDDAGGAQPNADADAPVDHAPIPITGAALRGRVAVRGPVGARVVVDGVDVGATPLDAMIVPGTHTIEVNAPGHAPWRESVDVVEGDNPIIDAKLKPYKKRPTAAPKDASAAPVDEEEPEPVSEPLPDKPPPLKRQQPPLLDGPTKKPPPPPDPSAPFLPTAPDDGAGG
ncbi:MAG: serine/threonine protein kinase [Deltaproteobacteria bacterium]|nr:serine/threonine protein kinase [Deltaproteobacteria bacterium]